MREIVMDTETTGLDPLRGDRLVEIGCLEIFNRMPTGQTFHVYCNPERDMPQEAFKDIPLDDLWIFQGTEPGPLSVDQEAVASAGLPDYPFPYRRTACAPLK